MRKTVSLLRKIGILIVAVPLFIVGVILIPLPGPGLLVCFAALFLLSLEFEQAKPHVERIRKQLDKIVQKSKRRAGHDDDAKPQK
jgi:uncharacterized protein (TIGR02611 family)